MEYCIYLYATFLSKEERDECWKEIEEIVFKYGPTYYDYTIAQRRGD